MTQRTLSPGREVDRAGIRAPMKQGEVVDGHFTGKGLKDGCSSVHTPNPGEEMRQRQKAEQAAQGEETEIARTNGALTVETISPTGESMGVDTIQLPTPQPPERIPYGPGQALQDLVDGISHRSIYASSNMPEKVAWSYDGGAVLIVNLNTWRKGMDAYAQQLAQRSEKEGFVTLLSEDVFKDPQIGPLLDLIGATQSYLDKDE